MAQNIWDDAFKNTLQKPGRIDRYLKDDPDIINKVGGQNLLTPLAGACYNGHLEVVTLLLQKGARPNALCPHGRTALFFTLRQAPRNQLPIVKALLAAPGADPNEVYPEDGNSNALTIAIEESQDKDLIYALMDAGAKPTEENKKQAKAKKMGKSLQPWKDIVGSLVDLAASAVSLIITYTEGGAVNAITKGALKKMYKINAQNNPVAAEIPEPKSVKDFTKNINNFVQNTGLDRFFAKKPEFLKSLAEKAFALRSDPNTSLAEPANLNRLIKLSCYQLVIYCDDSGSMSADNDIPGQKKTRYQSQCELVSRITNVATKLLPNDAVVKLRFINNPFDRDITIAEVDGVMASGFRGGGTALGAQLVGKILQPLVYDKLSNPGYVFEQPLLICTMTDGAPNRGDIPIKQVVTDCNTALVNKQYDPTSVMFCISQIGTDPSAKNFLDSVRNEKAIEHVVYCTADQLDVKFAQLRDNERELEVWLLDMLTKPIMRQTASSP